ncbi:macro domain-containing protein [Sorangium sp. So ce1099]|uniref:macro domain-containing protein n=1 Tax=Sorangium sp. So ce1099 TaxID=3133331 RepID=UPI003F5E89AE
MLMENDDPPQVTLKPFEYTINSSVVRVEYCDITTLSADVLVSSDDTDLSMGGGVSLSLLTQGGHEIFHEAQGSTPISLGEVVLTGAGRLKAKKIIHCAVIDYSSPSSTNLEIVRSVTRKCLALCDAQRFTSIAFPALATGVARLSPERSAAAMLMAIADYVSGATQIQSITIALFPRFSPDHDVAMRFYAKIKDFVDLTRHLESTSLALAKLEQLYRELGSVNAAVVAADSRTSLGNRRDRLEEAVSFAEPDDGNGARAWLGALEDVESELESMSSSMARERLPSGIHESLDPRVPRGPGKENWLAIERQYKEERRGALRALIAIREKYVTEIELRATMRTFNDTSKPSGADLETDALIASASSRLQWLKDELRDLEAELRGASEKPRGRAAATRQKKRTSRAAQGASRLASLDGSATHVLHLSDLHFGTSDDADLWSSQLAADLQSELGCSRLDAVILSGDIANRSTPEEYAAARQFLDTLSGAFHLSSQQVILVPGNHDLHWGLAKKAYKLVDREELSALPTEGSFIDIGSGALRIRDETLYPRRFEHFARFYQDVRKEPYPLAPEAQALLYTFPEQNLLVLGLNSAWNLDHHFKDRASIHPLALGRALDEIRRTAAYAPYVKIAVWHHPIASPFPDRITEHGFLERLAQAGFRLGLHGHIHKADNALFRYDQAASGRQIELLCAGTFGAPTREWVPGYPLQYQLLRLKGDTLTVETRRREEPSGTWKPDARWTSDRGKDPLPRYTVRIA